ncbi:MAG: acyl-CoA carboxylase subunit beta [Bdellovibrionales bacterium]|nr:acyl-CoA carboxylase subunit beta [Bdellovibrionales bacterium]
MKTKIERVSSSPAPEKKTNIQAAPPPLTPTYQKLKELRKKNKAALNNSGKEQIRGSCLTARERLNLLLDPGSFTELDRFIIHRSSYFDMQKKQIPGDGVITGYGKINRRKVFVYSQDFTVFGGSMSRTQANKILKIMNLALKNGAPIIGLKDSGGARIQEGVAALGGYGDIMRLNVRLSGVVPQISAIMGPCAGGAVYSPALADFIFMVDNSSYMFLTGPEVIKAVTHEEISKEDLGGAKTHTEKSGIAHFACQNDKQCLMMIRTLLSFLPDNNLDDPFHQESKDPVERRSEILNQIIPDQPKKPYDMKAVIKEVIDDSFFLELKEKFAPNIITGFARLNGHSVGIVANQPQVLAGCINIAASQKAARFIRLCDCFNIPIISFVDVPGFLPGTDQEHGAVISHGAKLLYAYAEASVPKITLITRKAYGGAYIVMGSKHLGGDLNFAYPSAEIAVMGAEGAVNIIARKQIKQASDPEKERIKQTKKYEMIFNNPYRAAELGYIDAVIEPSQTREHIIGALEILQNKREKMAEKKHGNIPL